MRACLHLCQHPLSAPLHPKTVLYSADSFMGNQRQAGCPGRAGPGVAQSGGVPHQGATHAVQDVAPLAQRTCHCWCSLSSLAVLVVVCIGSMQNGRGLVCEGGVERGHSLAWLDAPQGKLSCPEQGGCR